MNKVSLFFILVFALTNAQTHRFFYELKYKNDSTMPVSKKKFMVLDINPKEIKYYENQINIEQFRHYNPETVH